MSLQHDYQRVARRSLDASQASLDAGIQEKSAFLSYHAFESSGCALSIVSGLPVGPGIHHNVKITHFRTAARRLGNNRSVALMAVSLASIRNKLLYPIQDSVSRVVTLPENTVTSAQAQSFITDVTIIVNWVDTHI